MLPCPACESAEFRPLFQASDRLYGTTDKIFHVIECASCRLMRLHPRPEPAELHQYYPEQYWYSPSHDAASRLEDIYRRAVLNDHLRFAERAIRDSGENGMVLDVGCGGGLFLHMLRRRGFSVAGLDFSLAAAEVAWRQNGVPAVCAMLSRAPFADETFAAITMYHVLEHLYDPAIYLEAAHRMLKPGGRLIVQVPNAACWQFLILGESWNGLDVPRHLFNFRSKDLDGLLSACGFEVLRHKYFSLRDNPAGLATSVAPGLDPMARRMRRAAESPNQRLMRDLFYLALVVMAVPFTLFEAACRQGSTVMVEARKKS